ncbi:bifunctional phosphoribosyl-AMP cyclohydrolase/phosphoribosyl-ATP diphosphatase HisIE [Paenibacillus apiarius]|uniref:bifunctional phosphoribosyl-AMP cyclohydrolase/phosphoribosyl-ATP diphosphatase HisIE n=1 Tax=Paenibacillus apiarius TaxID=46240 RepID=UPI0019820AA6|nr:bifunctional phosphoribosyl-AMP cyclohydrolase/phosphoribosyl-ATP diphosphatase HisIE [Paenibacillus apiarius]MBN3524468.1 bifunctional phosphoribosyl-AMP cyclohydrolase/phosphoribosyl-ATP diphosphatase HisIE [Paenibacillus apiarius]
MTANQTAIQWEELADRLRWNEQGLVPAVVQDAASKQVLMVAYMNRESLRLSCELGETVFWSRSREEIWHKGATSGNTQRIVSIAADCDQDTLLVQVVPNGPACHTGRYTCFFNACAEQESSGSASPLSIISDLESMIAEREAERPEGAYTSYLFDKGVDKILKKVGEEAAEVIIAAKNGDNAELRNETGDLLFHLLVLLRERKLPLDEVLAELQRRHQTPRRDTYDEHGKV